MAKLWFLLLLTHVAEPSEGDRHAAVLALEKIGAGVEVGDKAPGRPVVGVLFLDAVTNEQLSVLALPALKAVRRITLTETKIGDDGLRHIARLKELRSLDLTSTRVTDKALLQITQLPSLTELSLNNTAVG